MQDEDNLQAKSEPVKLTDITRGLYHAASSTYSMVANQYISLLSQYFDETQEGTYVPKTIVVQLPDDTTVDLPLISLVSPKGLMLDKVDFDFAVVADPSALAQATSDLDGLNLTRSSFKVEMAAIPGEEGGNNGARKREGVVDISMKFTAVEPPEGLMRLLDKFASIVTPIKPRSATANYLPLLSPRFFFIAKVLTDDAILREKFEQFNASEFVPSEIERKGKELQQWEGELLAISVEIDRLKEGITPVFKTILEYARIAFKDTDDYAKLKLSQKFSSRPREWTSQVMQFYKSLDEDESVSFKLARLQHPESITEAPISSLWRDNYKNVKEVARQVEAYDKHIRNKSHYEEAKDWLQTFNSIARILLKADPALLAKLFPDSEFLNK